MRKTCSKRLCYEVPDYFYSGPEGTLEYHKLDAYNNDNEGKLDMIKHKIRFTQTNGATTIYTADDVTGRIAPW